MDGLKARRSWAEAQRKLKACPTLPSSRPWSRLAPLRENPRIVVRGYGRGPSGRTSSFALVSAATMPPSHITGGVLPSG